MQFKSMLDKRKTTIPEMLPWVITLMLLLSVLYLLNNVPILSGIGQVIASLIPLVTFVFVVMTEIKSKLTAIGYVIIIYVFFNLILLILSPSTDNLVEFIQHTSLMCFAVSLSFLEVNDTTARRCIVALSVFFICSLLLSLIFFFLVGLQEIRAHLSITFFKVLFICIYFVLVLMKSAKARIAVAVCAGIAFYVLGERSTAVLCIVVPVMSGLLRFIKAGNRKTMYSVVYWIVAVFSVAFPHIYLWLYQSSFSASLESFSRQYFGGTLFNGRETLWQNALTKLEGNELFGLGFGNTSVDDGLAKPLSVHNLFLFLELQGGYVLLILFFVILFLFWRKYYSYLEDTTVRYSAVFLIAIMLQMNYEVALVSSKYIVSLFYWFVIGFGLMVVKHKERAKEKENESAGDDTPVQSGSKMPD